MEQHHCRIIAASACDCWTSGKASLKLGLGLCNMGISEEESDHDLPNLLSSSSIRLCMASIICKLSSVRKGAGNCCSATVASECHMWALEARAYRGALVTMVIDVHCCDEAKGAQCHCLDSGAPKSGRCMKLGSRLQKQLLRTWA